MADERNASLHEFADIIQEKAGSVPRQHSGQPGSGSRGAGDTEPASAPVAISLPRWSVAGMLTGLGIVVGYLIGKRRH